MPNNKKIKVSKIKGAEKAHPFSRKAAQLQRAFAREHRVSAIKSSKDVERTRIVDKLVWFKFALDDHLSAATPIVLHSLILDYINRNSDEIDALKASIRPNRPKPPRLTLLTLLQQKELHEYSQGGGMHVPDLLDATNVAALRKWEGDYYGISLVTMVTVRQEKLVGSATQESVDVSVDSLALPLGVVAAQSS